MTTKKSKVRGLVLSDIHLFHDKVKTEHIVDGLYRVLTDNEKMRDIDIIFISGDLFDHSVFLPSGDVKHVYMFCNYLLNLCFKYDIVLRILEGTPSHDWKQSKMVIELNEMRENKVDVKHMVNLSIEHIEKFDINVLYVPDEWGSGCASTFEEVQDLLIKNNLEKVDFSIMHGCFNFQFPINLVGKPDVHDEQSYLDITKHLIFIGHYHTPGIFERIYVPGSFDRLKHGEEEPKGYLHFVVYEDDTYNVNFIENKRAMKFNTLDFTSKPVDEIIRTLDSYISDKNEERHIRINANRDDPIVRGLTELKRLFPSVHFTVSTNKEKKQKMVSKTEDIVRPQSLTQETLLQLIEQRLLDKHPERVNECMSLLKGVIDATATNP